MTGTYLRAIASLIANTNVDAEGHQVQLKLMSRLNWVLVAPEPDISMSKY